jgi:F0F1-type ATP synthase assembly protein I
VILTRDPETRRFAGRILLAQALVMTVIAAICYAFLGERSGTSALTGGAIGLIANALMTVTALRPADSAGAALGRLLFGQMMKVGFTVALLVIVARGGWAHWPSLLAAYAATLFVYWLVPMLMYRTGRTKV